MLVRTVLFVAPSAYTLGGLAVWLEYLLPGLRHRGWRAVLGLVEGPRHHRVKPYLDLHPDDDAISIPCFSGTQAGRARAVSHAVRNVAPDVVVSVNIPDAIIATANLRARGVTSTRAMIACHGIQRELFADMLSLRDHLDGVACTNRLACHLSSQLGGVEASRVHYAPCGTAMQSQSGRKRTGVFRVLWVGRLEQDQKRVLDVPDILQRALAASKSIEIVFAGTGPEERRLRESLANRSVSDQCRFLGFVPLEKLPQVYAESDALLVTSRWETGPITIWEAMSVGVPVVSTSYVGSGLEHALVDGVNCLLFPVGDTGAAARCLGRLATDEQLTEQLISRGKETIATRYSRDSSIGHWEDALFRLLDAPLVIPPTQLIPTEAGVGQLSRIFGNRVAEWLRGITGRIGPDAGAGGEWPHTLSGANGDESAFWQLAETADRGGQAVIEGGR